MTVNHAATTHLSRGSWLGWLLSRKDDADTPGAGLVHAPTPHVPAPQPSPIRSNRPAAPGNSVSAVKILNLMLELPAFTTSTFDPLPEGAVLRGGTADPTGTLPASILGIY